MHILSETIKHYILPIAMYRNRNYETMCWELISTDLNITPKNCPNKSTKDTPLSYYTTLSRRRLVEQRRPIQFTSSSGGCYCIIIVVLLSIHRPPSHPARIIVQ